MTKIQNIKYFPLTLTLSPKGEGLSSVVPLSCGTKEGTFTGYYFLSPASRGGEKRGEGYFVLNIRYLDFEFV